MASKAATTMGNTLAAPGHHSINCGTFDGKIKGGSRMRRYYSFTWSALHREHLFHPGLLWRNNWESVGPTLLITIIIASKGLSVIVSNSSSSTSMSSDSTRRGEHLIGRLLRNHNGSGVGVARYYVGHYRGIDDVQILCAHHL